MPISRGFSTMPSTFSTQGLTLSCCEAAAMLLVVPYS